MHSVSTAIVRQLLDWVCRTVWPLFFTMVAILLHVLFVACLVMLLPRLAYAH